MAIKAIACKFRSSVFLSGTTFEYIGYLDDDDDNDTITSEKPS